MNESTAVELSSRGENGDPLSDLLGDGSLSLTHSLTQQGVEAELVKFMAKLAGRFLQDSRAVLVRNGYET